MTDWDQLAADTGYELYFYEQRLINGALEIGGAARVIEARETDGWELVLIGHRPDAVQMCFRRALPDREARLADLTAMRRLLEARAADDGGTLIGRAMVSNWKDT